MTQAIRPNLYDQFLGDIKITDILLDVGYGNLLDLIDFEYLFFKNNLDSNGEKITCSLSVLSINATLQQIATI